MRDTHWIMAAVLMMFLVSIPLCVAEWQTEVVDSAGEVGRSSCIVLGSDGYPRISYYKNDSKDLKFARRTATGWDPLTLDVSGDAGLMSSMCLRAGQFPYIAYVNTETKEMKLAYFQLS